MRLFCIFQILICPFYFFPVFLSGQSFDFSFHQLTQEQGLLQGDNEFVSQDSKGFIWISSRGGLNRFDGQSIKVYKFETNNSGTLADNLVSSPCFEDEENNLWFTTQTGVNCYQRDSDQIKRFPHPYSVLQNYSAFYLDSYHQLWLRIEKEGVGYLFYFDIKNKTYQQSSHELEGTKCQVISNSTKEVKQIIVSHLLKEKGIIILDIATESVQKVLFQMSRYEKEGNLVNTTQNVFIDGDSLIWTGLYNSLGTYNIHKKKAEIIETKNTSLIQKNNLGWLNTIIPFGGSQYLLISSTEAGLLLFDKEKKEFNQQFLPQPNNSFSLPTNNLLAIFKDGSDNLWVSIKKKGLAFSHLEKNKFPKIANTIGKTISSIWEDSQQRIWCSSKTSGTFVFDQQKNLLFHTRFINNISNTLNTDFPLPELPFFLENKSNHFLWSHMGNALLKWDISQQKFIFKTPYFLGQKNITNAVVHLSNNKILTAINNRLYYLQLNENDFDTISWHAVNHLKSGIINALYQDKNQQIYIGDEQNNLWVVKETSTGLQKIKHLENIPTCHAFYEDKKNEVLWMATANGLFKLYQKDFNLKKLTNIDGLPVETYYTVLADTKGQLWLSGNNGLIRYDTLQKTHHRYTMADGLQNPEFNPRAGIVSSSGDIWVGGVNGLNVFKPETIEHVSQAPQVQLTRILINDKENPNYRVQLGQDAPLVLPYEDNTVSFEIVALEYSDPDNNQLEYMLEGVDKEWLSAGSKTLARYPKLAKGTYQLLVKATNSDGISMKKPAVLTIQSLPHFTETWWFYLLCTLAISAIIYAWFQYRLQQALKIERLRVKISSDLHDDVGTLLSGLAMQTEILEMTAPDQDKPRLQRVGELARSAMSRMRDTVWAIDARKDKLENLIDRMREHAEETLTARDIAFDLKVENLDFKKNLTTDVRQNLYLIYKEAITNIAKHSSASQVNIVLQKVGAAFEMRIEDNGQTVKKNYKTTGSGLMNMKMRAEQIGGTLEFYQKDGFGILLRRKD